MGENFERRQSMSDIVRVLQDIRNDVRELRKSHEETDRVIRGNGQVTGIVGRVEKLEQKEEGRRWLARTTLAGVVALGIKQMWDSLKS